MVYQDHGPQIMIASYGLVYCEGLMRLVSYLANSPAAFDTKSPHFEMVLRFIRETQLSSIRGKSWDFSVLGRGVSRENATITPINYLQCLADSIDPVHAPEYLNALSRLNGDNPANYKVREFNKHYWDSDYTQHMRSSFLFTVRNTSSRTVESEVGNGENLKANYFSYGANFISVDGDEYKNIMPVWDWSMIPGTTYPHITSFPTRKNWGVNYGKTDFVGGISDGIYGVSVLDLDDAGIKAKKSWFFFDDEIVCLGDSIRYSGSINVRTTINQTRLTSASYINEVGSSAEITQSLNGSSYANTNLKYLRNGKVAYYFPQQGNIKYTMKSQSGTWASINSASGSADVKSGYVLSLWVDHGTAPTDAS
jgi:chondroitin AC lyase